MRRAVLALALCCLPLAARAQMRVQDDYYASLTPASILSFLKNVDALSSTKSDLSAQDLAVYFGRHLADGASFSSKTTYTLPGQDPNTVQSTLTKAQFITGVQQGEGIMTNYQSQMDIKDVQIAADEKSATLTSVSTDSGVMTGPDGKAVPIKGQSTCWQTVRLALGLMQLAGADCETTVSSVGQ